ncbi:O-antigen ligase family protein [Gudongella sp. SC589]|uniref:O-antigen ligase family protein n=1 Tax=Gudongella sp. SC589 TaxID=3385990 RepID=UPI003904D424
MGIKDTLKNSFFIGLLMKIKYFAENSFIFSMELNKDGNAARKEHKSWIYSSLFYRLLARLDNLARMIEEKIHTGVKGSKLLGWSLKEDKSLARPSEAGGILGNSLIYKGFSAAFNSPKWSDLLMLLPVLYVAVDYVVRRLPVINMLGSVWDELLLLFMAGVFILKRIASGGRIRYNFGPMDLPVIIYIILGVSHVLIKAPDLGIAIEGFRSVFQHILWYFIATQYIRTIRDSERVMNVMMALGLFLGLHAIYQYLVKVPMPGNWVDTAENITTRAFSIIGSPNILGVIFVLYIPIGVAMALAAETIMGKVYYGGVSLVMIAGLLFTMSRGAWLAFAFAAGIFVIILVPKLIIPFAGLGGAFVLFGGALSDRLLYMLSPVYLMKSAAGGRLYRWNIGLEIWRRDTTFGMGLGRYGGAVAMNNNLTPFYLDNYYLKTLTEMGIYGIGALLFVIISFIASTARIIRSQTVLRYKIMVIGLFAGAMGVLAQNFVENIFEVPAMIAYFWITVALINTYSPSGEAE